MRQLILFFFIAIVPNIGFGQSTSSAFVPLVNIPGTSANLPGGVKGVAVDSVGNVFFCSGRFSVLRWEASTGNLTTAAGNGTPGYSGDNGPATSAQLQGVVGIAIDGSGNLYIADAEDLVIRKVSNGVITTVAGGGSYPDCDNCPATSASLGDLTGVTADAAGDLYIFTEGIIRKVSNGIITRFHAMLFPNGAEYISGSAVVDSVGDLYVADPDFNLIHKVSNGVVTTVAGTGTLGFSGDNGPATGAQLTAPRGVAVDSDGNVYIADTGNQRIRKVSNGVITTVAGGGSPSAGLGDNGPATSGVLNFPFGVAVDAAGTLYVEDTLDQRIRKVTKGTIATVAGGGSTSVVVARSAGTFTPTGSMGTARSGHTATLLQSGKVLVSGGYARRGYIASSELYDPASQTFSGTGGMIQGLAEPTAILLADGRILFVGAQLDGIGLASAELYDPSAGTFSSAGSSRSIVSPATVTLLQSGAVLVIGANGPNPSPITNFVAELYDPTTGVFVPTGKMVWPHTGGTATLLASGAVLFADGICGGDYGSDVGGSEIYDPIAGKFSPTAGNMPCRAESTASLLPNGTVLIAGGFGMGAEVYDPSTQTFATIGGFDAAWSAATLLPDASVLVTGGAVSSPGDINCPDESVDDGDLYDPSTETFGSAGVMTTPRDLHASTLLSDGTVLITGGEWIDGSEYSVLATAEIYSPAVLVPAPVLFSISADGQGQGAIWNAATGQLASSATPVAAGDVLAMYTANLMEGGVVPPQVAIGGRLAEILYSGDAPGYPGYFQVNFRVPGGVAPGSGVPVRLTYLGRPSNAVTIGVR